MKRFHRFAFYCTLLIPVGAMLGLGVGEFTGLPVLMTAGGVAAGVVASWLLGPSARRSERP